MNSAMEKPNSPKIISIFYRKNTSPKKKSSNKLKQLPFFNEFPGFSKKETSKIISRQRKIPNKVSAIKQIPQKKFMSITPIDSEKFINNLINFIAPHKELIRPELINQSFNRKTAHKVIDGVKYKSLKDLKQNKLKCFFETCEISWENAKWIDR